MSDDPPVDRRIASEADFEIALRDILVAAVESGVDPRGARDYTFDDGTADWEVVVFELDRSDRPD